MKIKGIGLAKHVQLQAVFELVRRALREKLQDKQTLDTPQLVSDFLSLWLAGKDYESFTCLFLDVQNCLITAEEMFRGSLDQTAVYLREVARRALSANAAGVIVAHNHPMGTTQPSRSDLELVGVRLLDHFIVAGNQLYSFAQSGNL